MKTNPAKYIIILGIFILLFAAGKLLIGLIDFKKKGDEPKKLSSEWALRKGYGTKDNVFKLIVGLPTTTINPQPKKMYKVLSKKPYYFIGDQGWYNKINKPCFVFFGPKTWSPNAYFTFEGIEPDTEIKIEEGPCVNVKK